MTKTLCAGLIGCGGLGKVPPVAFQRIDGSKMSARKATATNTAAAWPQMIPTTSSTMRPWTRSISAPGTTPTPICAFARPRPANTSWSKNPWP